MRWGPPDLTLPLVEMAEMERPVMEVTVTDSKMMIQVRTVGCGGGDHHRNSAGALPR